MAVTWQHCTFQSQQLSIILQVMSFIQVAYFGLLISACNRQVHYIQGCTEVWSVVFCAPSHHIIVMYIQINSYDISLCSYPSNTASYPSLCCCLQADPMTCELPHNINLPVNCCLSFSISWLLLQNFDMKWKVQLLDSVHVCKPKENISSAFHIWWVKNLILTAVHWTESVDPNSLQTGMSVSATLPAILWNDLIEEWF
jgi:hypothetical protein